VDVFLQFLLLAGIGVCVWLAFHPSSRENYDDIETSRRLDPPLPAPRPGRLDTDFIASLPRRPVADWRLPPQTRATHDDTVPTYGRQGGAGDPPA
jgi:hypothetical protein